jgi:pheromone shutdown protein TraB
MYNITLIGTHHRELGKCNSDELYKIIESIRPDVIFVELSPDLLEKVFVGNHLTYEFLEVKFIKKYSESHNIRFIAVDIDPDQGLSMKDIESMFNTFKKYTVYKKIEDEQYNLLARDGFAFLNSKRNMNLFEEKKITERNLIEFMMNKNQLLRIWNYFYEEQENRDSEMLRNIYNYSKLNRYETAIFIIGAGHRKSLMQKIQEYEGKEEVKLNWIFYNN